jgi:hypothetical protein
MRLFLPFVVALFVAFDAGPARAGTVTYQVFQGGTNGTLLAEYEVPNFVTLGTNVENFTPTVLSFGLTSPGLLSGEIFAPTDPFADIIYFNALPFAGEIDAVLPSAEFPNAAGTFVLNTNLSQLINAQGLPVATPDTLVISVSITSPVPEPDSLILLGISVAGRIGYRWRRRTTV